MAEQIAFRRPKLTSRAMDSMTQCSYPAGARAVEPILRCCGLSEVPVAPTTTLVVVGYVPLH